MEKARKHGDAPLLDVVPERKETSPSVSTPTESPSTKIADLPAKRAGRAPARNVSDSRPVAALPSAISIIDSMAKIAPNLDVEKLDRLIALQERVMDRQEKADFDANFATMQLELPIVDRKGRIVVREKDGRGHRTGPIQQDSKYARFEDINEAVRPVLAKHGFGVRFETGLAEDGRVKVIGILSGYGHREQAEFVLPHDSTGSKNSVQAIGSSTSYGKRYALCALLNITTRGEDDGGVKGGEQSGLDRISPVQAEEIVNLCGSVGCNKKRLMNYLNGSSRPAGHPEVKEIEEIPASRYDEVIRGLNQIGKAGK